MISFRLRFVSIFRHFRGMERASDAFIHTHHIFSDPIVCFVGEIRKSKQLKETEI